LALWQPRQFCTSSGRIFFSKKSSFAESTDWALTEISPLVSSDAISSAKRRMNPSKVINPCLSVSICLAVQLAARVLNLTSVSVEYLKMMNARIDPPRLVPFAKGLPAGSSAFQRSS
jgi:hypothetical protein